MSDEELLSVLERVADGLPDGCSYIIAVQRLGDDAPTIYHTMADEKALASAFRSMARALEGDA